ncbi:MAG: hotdog fold thioesterase [Chloroflexota bacterium]
MSNKTVDPDVRAKIETSPFAAALGITYEEIGSGYCRVSLEIKPQHLNFHGTTHGGVIFALGDVAFAAACNSYGQTAFALNVDVSFLTGTSVGDHLVGEAKEISLNGPIGLYALTVKHAETGTLVAQSQAMAYRKRDSLI